MLLAADLRRRGFRLDVRGDRLHVSPADRLTPADVEAIRAHRDTLLAGIERDAAVLAASGPAAARRRLMDDEGFPLCPDCGGRALGDGMRTCPACGAAAIGIAA